MTSESLLSMLALSGYPAPREVPCARRCPRCRCHQPHIVQLQTHRIERGLLILHYTGQTICCVCSNPAPDVTRHVRRRYEVDALLEVWGKALTRRKAGAESFDAIAGLSLDPWRAAQVDRSRARP